MSTPQNGSLLKGLDEIERLIDELELDSTVKYRSTEIYRNALAIPGLISSGINRIVAGCILLASRESTSVIEARQVANHTAEHIDRYTIYRITKKLRNELDLGFMIADPHKFVDRIHSEFDAPDEHAHRAHQVVDIVVEDGITAGKKASAIAAAAFYLIGVYDGEQGKHGEYTQIDIAEAVSVSEVTIRNRYQEFETVIQESDDMFLDAVSA